MTLANTTEETGCRGWSIIYEDRQLRKRAISFAERLLPIQDKAEGEDIYQRAIVRLLKIDPNRIDDKVNYLLKTIRNLCYDWRSKPWRLSPVITVLPDSQRNEENEELLLMRIPDPKRGPALDAEVKEQNEKYLRTLALHCTDLDKRERELLSLHLCGYTPKEIAAEKGEDVKVVSADMNAVMAKIRYRVRFMKGNPGIDC